MREALVSALNQRLPGIFVEVTRLSNRAPDAPEKLIFDLGCHDLDLVLYDCERAVGALVSPTPHSFCMLLGREFVQSESLLRMERFALTASHHAFVFLGLLAHVHWTDNILAFPVKLSSASVLLGSILEFRPKFQNSLVLLLSMI